MNNLVFKQKCPKIQCEVFKNEEIKVERTKVKVHDVSMFDDDKTLMVHLESILSQKKVVDMCEGMSISLETTFSIPEIKDDVQVEENIVEKVKAQNDEDSGFNKDSSIKDDKVDSNEACFNNTCESLYLTLLFASLQKQRDDIFADIAVEHENFNHFNRNLQINEIEEIETKSNAEIAKESNKEIEKKSKEPNEEIEKESNEEIEKESNEEIEKESNEEIEKEIPSIQETKEEIESIQETKEQLESIQETKEQIESIVSPSLRDYYCENSNEFQNSITVLQKKHELLRDCVETKFNEIQNLTTLSQKNHELLRDYVKSKLIEIDQENEIDCKKYFEESKKMLKKKSQKIYHEFEQVKYLNSKKSLEYLNIATIVFLCWYFYLIGNSVFF